MNNFMLTIELTSKCNLRCLHCLRDKSVRRKDLPYSLFKKIIRQAKKYKNPHIALTGGEPTLHKDFFKILEFLSQEGFNYHFVTNGYNFSDLFGRLEPFHKKGLLKVCFSLDGASEEVHDGIRGKGSYRKVMEAIAICKAKGIPFTVQTVVNKFNRHELGAVAQTASKMRFEKLYFAHMQPSFGNISYDISLPPSEWLKIEEEVADLKKIYSVPIELSGGAYDESPLTACMFLQGTGLNIDYEGNLTLCCQISGVFDSSKRKDIVCSLKKTSLFKGHQKLIDKIASLQKKRLSDLEKGKLSSLDYFHCWYCTKELGKIDWMRVFKKNEWVKRDGYFACRAKGA